MEYEVKMDFYRDWISHLRKILEQAGYIPATNQEDVSTQYFNLLRRLIPVVPRKVLIAKEFQCPHELQSGLNIIKEKIEQGIDLRPHLSRLIADLTYDDDLLNDWDIHHLHLGTILEADGFVERDDLLLFVRFDEHNAYFINVMGHRSWTNQDMIRIIHRNWPESIERFRLKEAISLNKSVTDKDIKVFRKAHSVYFIEPEPGVIYAPPGMGLTTAGIGVEVVRVSDHYAVLMGRYEDVIKENIDELTEMMKDEGVNPGKHLSFILKIEEKNVLAYEENHNVTINLGEL
ncbi:hypothetical protein [Sporosarcina sp. YIM B06819]|uniref:hypothetical protein n=1 Tax=Sporosarcina sp. YIM B06819 TaxID=3081769 RepID=UPI00298D5B82|nr:hypothetical protein [Sporosarcina sp. YIM B06819]